MRYSGPAKRRREAAPGRIPPLWATRPTPGGPLWPPRYPPLGSPYFVPFLGGGPPEVQGACVGPSAQAAKKDKAKIVQFEWNGCTFYRYIPDGNKGAAAAAAAAAAAGRHMGTPGEPPIPPPPFVRPRSFEWHQRSSRSQSRRRKQQQVFPPRAPAPPWTPGPLPQDRPGSSKQFSVASAAAAAAAMSATGGGAGPYRPREPNPRIPRKENKTPASHVHLPPFLATTSSKAAAKSPSPTTATHVQGPPRAAAFRNKDSAAAAPLPFSLRAAFGADDCCASPAMSKRNETPGMLSGTNQASGGGGKPRVPGGGNMTVRRSQDVAVPESDVLGAKPKKPPRMNNMTFTKSPSDRSGGNVPFNNGNSKAFARAPPFRNSPRVYSSTVLKELSATGKQDSARGPAIDGRPILSVPRESTPKEQRAARQDRRVRYKAEIVGTNIIVTREEPSPEKKSDMGPAAAVATDQKATLPQTPGGTGVKKVEQGPSAPNGSTDTTKAEPTGWKDREESAFQSRILHAALLHGTSVADAERSSATADAFTQLTTFDINEQFDRFLSPGPRCVKQESAASLTHRKPPSGVEWSGKLRSIPVQTDEMEASTCEPRGKRESKQGNEILETDQQELVEKMKCKDVEAQKEAKREDNMREPLSEGEVTSPASYVDEPHTSSSEIYLDSLVSNGTSTPSPSEDAFRKPDCDKTLNTEGAVALLNELDDFLKDCSPIKGAQQPAEEQPVHRSCGSSTPLSEGASRNSCPESGGRETSSSPSSLSKGEGFSDISEPRSPLAKDLQVQDNASLASDVILINFAEDTTTLKEHLDGLVADYKAKQESDTVSGTGIAFSPEGEGCRPRSASGNGTNNVLEKHPGSSPTRSSAPVLLPSDVSPRELLNMASEEARTAGGDFRSSSVAKGPRQTQKDRVGEALSERGDSSFKITRKSPATGTIEIGRPRSLASCDSCGAVYCGSINSENFPRVCSCKTRHGARAKGSRPLIPVEIEEALKEEYRDPEIVSCFVEENVEYLLESEDEEYEQVVRRRSLTGRNLLGRQASHHERSGSGSDERSAAASQRYPENSTSWNKIKDASEASVISGTERCGSEPTAGGASRALIYDCPWWTYDQGEHDGATKGDSISTALGSCDQVSPNTSVAAAVAEIASNAAATLHPWSTTLRAAAAAAETGIHGATANGPGAVGEVPAAAAAAASSNNPWGPFLATAQAIVGPKREVVMSSGDHETTDEVSCRSARSDADFTTLYMEGQPRKPALKQRWPPSAELGAAVGPASQQQRATGGDRDSLSFYEFPLNDQHEALPPQQHSLSMETLVGSNRLDVSSTSSTGDGTERRLAEGEPMPPPPADAIDGKPSGGGSAQSPDAQYCELELYAPVSKNGPAVCTVVVPAHSMAEGGDGAKGEAVLLDTGPRPDSPPEDSGLCGDKKIAEASAKPMGKIRTRFRDFFWKHK
ncbi:uncharacterized protein [Dermacentor albipictus]|uniref:uncharacterized protein n=1 Tax=Dermacentor albipictus TaxID=60249 RepID=UPI0031FCD66C